MSIAIRCFALVLLVSTQATFAEIYTWKDDYGKVHYSDKKPVTKQARKVKPKAGNVLNFDTSRHTTTNNESQATHKRDAFRLPHKKSTVTYRFIMASFLNNKLPGDRLEQIQIDLKQQSLHSHVKLTDIERNKKYEIRLRVLDAKGELIFDNDLSMTATTNSMWFNCTITPTPSIDEPGTWTFQALLNNEQLFVEKRRVTF